MSEEATASLRMEANVFQVAKDGHDAFQAAIEDRGEGALGLTVSLPLPSGTEWVHVRLDLTSASALTAWLGHAVRVVEVTASEEEVQAAQEMLASLASKTAAPMNRQQRRAAERRGEVKRR